MLVMKMIYSILTHFVSKIHFRIFNTNLIILEKMIKLRLTNDKIRDTTYNR